MHRLRWIVSLLATLALLTIPRSAYAGGWAVITLVDLPHVVAARQPIPIEFVIRQHGHPDRLMLDQSPQVTATYAGHTVQVMAKPGTQPGHYHTILTLPIAGTWDWSIGAFTMDVALPPLIVHDTAPQDAPPQIAQLLAWIGWQPITPPTPIQPLADTRTLAEQGHDLYIAKGCATCHRHADVEVEHVIEIGPNLTGFTPDPHATRLWLQNAAAFTASRDWPMPTLELTDVEIDALIAFLAE